MLIGPAATQKLKNVTEIAYYPETTHWRRNQASRLFLEETEKLLDLQAESMVKQAVEDYCAEKISSERYEEILEKISQEEEQRGAIQGGAYARGKVFYLAQILVEKDKENKQSLALLEIKRQYVMEKRRIEKEIKDFLLQGITELQKVTQQKENEILIFIQQQKEAILEQQQDFMNSLKTEIEDNWFIHLQEEKSRLEKEIRKEEALKPFREAVQEALKKVKIEEKEMYMLRRKKGGFIGLGIISALLYIFLFFFYSSSRGIISLLAIVTGALFIMPLFWKDSKQDDKTTKDLREIVFFQTEQGDYKHLNEQERCTLLVQRIF